ncbi:MAG: hypothetical protein JSW73_01385 [Candidatus Woesearchaeota archaeon]|nr:MAG: hypothetical protein JSW73_01385 [Candidatus Woesearchaeota archaeon]
MIRKKITPEIEKILQFGVMCEKDFNITCPKHPKLRDTFSLCVKLQSKFGYFTTSMLDALEMYAKAKDILPNKTIDEIKRNYYGLESYQNGNN